MRLETLARCFCCRQQSLLASRASNLIDRSFAPPFLPLLVLFLLASSLVGWLVGWLGQNFITSPSVRPTGIESERSLIPWLDCARRSICLDVCRTNERTVDRDQLPFLGPLELLKIRLLTVKKSREKSFRSFR